LDLPIAFRIYLPSCPEVASSPLSGRLYDYSQQGLALLTNTIHCDSLHIFHPNTITSEQCLLEIRVPEGDQGVTLHGRVVWYDRIDDESPFLFRVGIRLLEVPRELRRQLESTLREQRTGADPHPPVGP
jgi:hypothetical protein